MFTISKESFARITGTELDHFLKHILVGDSWGVFLKITTVIESSSKRAIGLKLAIDPDLPSVANLELLTALRLCRDIGLVTDEAFNFANRLRSMRNELVHSGKVLNLSLDEIFKNADGPKYMKSLDEFVRIEGQSALDGAQQHQNALLFACVAYAALLAKALLQDDWLGASSA